jgi:peptidoglycan hydrolase-like protein with peptidoglycan-binding domain
VVIAGLQPRGRFGALVVTAAAVATLGFASPALASTSGVEAQSTVKPADLIPDASWHGRAIRRPDRTRTQLREPTGSVLLQQGAGLRRPGGSGAVREVQRRLLALGYRIGPADGAFGPRTRSSVAWFQIKHRLPATGAVDGATLGLLRFRTHGVPTRTVAGADRSVGPPPAAAESPEAAPQARPVQAPPARPVQAPPARPVQAPHRPARADAGSSTLLTVFALGLALLMVAALAQALQTQSPFVSGAQIRTALRKLGRAPARSAADRRGRPGGAVAARPSPPRARNGASPAVSGSGGRVIGYAVGATDGDVARQFGAMERVCGERGWTLAALVRERASGGRDRERRPGLAHVLAQIRAGDVAQLVVGRLQSLARSPAELATLLEWCGRRGVGVVALDVGLDTSTAEGRLAARCLGAVAVPAQARRASQRANGKLARSKGG